MKQYMLTNHSKNFLEVLETEVPSPMDHEVVIKIGAVSLNYRDLLIAKNIPGNETIPLSDGAGTVLKVGRKVSTLKVGDRVAGLFFPDWISGGVDSLKTKHARGGGTQKGMLAEYVTGPESSFELLPSHLSLEEGATLPCAGVTAWAALYAGSEIKFGEVVLLQGTGGVSIFALQLAKAKGARVIITSSQNEKLERARKLGADHLINYKERPDWEKEVLSLTDGRGVDRVIEVGGGGTLEKSIMATRMGGRISLIGVLTGFDNKINPVPLFQKNQTLHGIYVGSGEMQKKLGQDLEQFNIHPLIDRVFPVEESLKAFEYLENGKHFGKVVIKFS